MDPVAWGRRTASWQGATLAVAALLAACGGEPEPPSPVSADGPRAVETTPGATDAPAAAATGEAEPDVHEATARAVAWLDRLAIDVAELRRHGIDGVKKLAEALEAYELLARHAADHAERERFRRRARNLAAQTRDPDYHDFADYDEAEFAANSMSYLRVAWLMDQLDLDTAAYRAQIARLQPRLDAHLAERGGWQRTVFARFYDHFGLEKPPELEFPTIDRSALGRRAPVAELTPSDGYELTHIVFAAYDYGRRRDAEDAFDADELAYLRAALPALLEQSMQVDFPDLAAELVSCMTYLGWADAPAARRAEAYLLSSQKPDGSWGDYEKLRAQYGDYLEQQLTLHTVQVALRAILEGAQDPGGGS